MSAQPVPAEPAAAAPAALLTAVTGGVLTLTLNRPQVLNAITPELLESWIKEDASDFERTGTDPDAVLEETVRLQPEARRRAADLFDRFVAGVTANS